MNKYSVVVGDQFGRWTVLYETHAEPSAWQISHGYAGARAAMCRCECNTEKIVRITDLFLGTSKSCGCLKRELHAVWAAEKFTTHGLTPVGNHHIHYREWSGIVDRCTNPNNKSFVNYGQRGISVYSQWLDDPVTFCAWMDENLGNCPEGYSIDRINNNGNYEPGNLRYSDRSTQTINSRNVLHEGVGASQLPSGRYQAEITRNGNRKYLGVFDTEEQAAEAYAVAQGEGI